MLYLDPYGVQGLVKEKGLFGSYLDGRGTCCGVRKVAHPRRKIEKLKA